MFKDLLDVVPRASQHVGAFRSLDARSLAEIFQRRAVMCFPSRKQCAMRIALPGSDERAQLLFEGQQWLDSCSCFVPESKACAERSSWKIVIPKIAALQIVILPLLSERPVSDRSLFLSENCAILWHHTPKHATTQPN